MDHYKSRVDLAFEAFQLGYATATYVIKMGMPLSEIIRTMPDFKKRIEQMRKIIHEYDEKEKFETL